MNVFVFAHRMCAMKCNVTERENNGCECNLVLYGVSLDIFISDKNIVRKKKQKKNRTNLFSKSGVEEEDVSYCLV